MREVTIHNIIIPADLSSNLPVDLKCCIVECPVAAGS